MPIYNHSAIGLRLKWSDYQWITTHQLSSIPVQLECQVLPLIHWITTKITRFPTDIHSTSQLQSSHRRWVMPIHFNYLPLHCHLSSSMLPTWRMRIFQARSHSAVNRKPLNCQSTPICCITNPMPFDCQANVTWLPIWCQLDKIVQLNQSSATDISLFCHSANRLTEYRKQSWNQPIANPLSLDYHCSTIRPLDYHSINLFTNG